MGAAAGLVYLVWTVCPAVPAALLLAAIAALLPRARRQAAGGGSTACSAIIVPCALLAVATNMLIRPLATTGNNNNNSARFLELTHGSGRDPRSRRISSVVNNNYLVRQQRHAPLGIQSTLAPAADPHLPSWPRLPPALPLRYYAKGAMAWPSITYFDTSGQDARAWLAWPAFATWLALHTFVDYPLRWLSGGRLASKVAAVPANSQAYDLALGRQLWEECAQMAGLPAEVELGGGAAAAAQPPFGGKQAKGSTSRRQSRGSA